MTPDQAYRAGFLAYCAEHRIPLEAVPAMIKRADLLGGAANAAGNAATAVAYKIPALALGATALTGLATGAGLGAAAGHVTEADTDPADVRHNELVSLYRQYADIARRQQAHRAYKPPRRTRPV